MSFRESFFTVKGTLVERLHDLGISTDINDTWMDILDIDFDTVCSINVPLSLVYSDEFNITGVLETSYGGKLSGKTVKLKVGNTVVDTVTTNYQGAYSFTQTPVNTGNHSFQVVFEGSGRYNASNSSVITREVGKETSVLQFNTIAPVNVGDTQVISGTLLTDDGEVISGATVSLCLDTTASTLSYETLTTDSNGNFSYNHTGDVDRSISITYDGDSNYTNSTANGNATLNPPLITLSSDKPILSYADNEYATLTATVDSNVNTEYIKFSNHSLIMDSQTNYPCILLEEGNAIILKNPFWIHGNIVESTFELHSGNNTVLDYIDMDNYYINDGVSTNYVRITNFNNVITGDYGYGVDDDSIDWINSAFYEKPIAELDYDGDGIYLMIYPNLETASISPIFYKSSSVNSGTGTASVTYNSRGVGDVEFVAYVDDGILFSETYSIQDIYKYDAMTSDKGLFSVQSGSATITYGSDGVTITGTTTTETKILANIQLPSSDYEITYDINALTRSSNGYTLQCCFEDLLVGNNNTGTYVRKVSVSGDIWGGKAQYNPPCTMKLEITGTNTKTIKIYRNDVQVGSTITGISQTRVMQFLSYADNRGMTLKNLKIKPL